MGPWFMIDSMSCGRRRGDPRAALAGSDLTLGRQIVAQDDGLKDSPSARAVQDRHAAWALPVTTMATIAGTKVRERTKAAAVRRRG